MAKKNTNTKEKVVKTKPVKAEKPVKGSSQPFNREW